MDATYITYFYYLSSLFYSRHIILFPVVQEEHEKIEYVIFLNIIYYLLFYSNKNITYDVLLYYLHCKYLI